MLAHSPFDTALTRARADPTRVLSQDPTFLRAVYDHVAAVRHPIPADLALDTSAAPVADLAIRIAARLAERR